MGRTLVVDAVTDAVGLPSIRFRGVDPPSVGSESLSAAVTTGHSSPDLTHLPKELANSMTKALARLQPRSEDDELNFGGMHSIQVASKAVGFFPREASYCGPKSAVFAFLSQRVIMEKVSALRSDVDAFPVACSVVSNWVDCVDSNRHDSRRSFVRPCTTTALIWRIAKVACRSQLQIATERKSRSAENAPAPAWEQVECRVVSCWETLRSR